MNGKGQIRNRNKTVVLNGDHIMRRNCFQAIQIKMKMDVTKQRVLGISLTHPIHYKLLDQPCTVD